MLLPVRAVAVGRAAFRPDSVRAMPVSLPLTGGCGCGAVRFEVDAPLVGAAYCHCTRCQHRSGTGMQASARATPGSVHVVAGAEHLTTWLLADGLGKVFCDTCGSALFATAREGGEIVIVRMAAFDGDPGVRPGAHQFVAYAAPWEPVPDDGLPRFDERMPG